jgi:MoaA/NifB/PqqE/SkfB family radical SAM enzyme
MAEAKRTEYFIINKCTNHCVFCSESWRFDGTEISLARIKKTLLNEKKNGTELVHFLGGEPTLHSRCREVFALARDLGLRTYVMTNGVPLANRNFSKELLPLIDEVCISLHGPDPRVHDRLTRHPGSFKALKKTLDHLRLYHPEGLAADTTLTRGNLKHLKRIASILKRYKISTWNIITVIPSGRGKTNFCEIVPRLDDARKTLPSFFADAARKGLFPRIAGLPLCVFGEKYLRHSLDYGLNVFKKGNARRHGGALKLWMEPGDTKCEIDMGRVKPDRCSLCGQKTECGGIFEAYYLRFGDKELRPF